MIFLGQIIYLAVNCFFFYWPPKRDGNANVNAYKTDLIECTYRHDTCQNFTEANFKTTRKFTQRTRKLSHFWHSETPFLALESSSNQGDREIRDGRMEQLLQPHLLHSCHFLLILLLKCETEKSC